MGSGLKSRKKRDNYSLPQYLANENELKWYDYCVKNEIRISPIGIHKDPNNWHIEVRLGPYKKGEQGYVSPNVYDRESIWKEYYLMCKYYYDKHTRGV